MRECESYLESRGREKSPSSDWRRLAPIDSISVKLDLGLKPNIRSVDRKTSKPARPLDSPSVHRIVIESYTTFAGEYPEPLHLVCKGLTDKRKTVDQHLFFASTSNT